MKTLKLISIGIVLFATNMVQSQVSIHVNIGTPIIRVPIVQASVDYYYLPEVQAYYDVREANYVYLNQGNWCRARYLPGIYRNYDIQHCSNKVVLYDYHGSRPYEHYNNHKVKYAKSYKEKNNKSNGWHSNYYAYNNKGHYDKYEKDDDYGRHKH